MGLYIDVAIKFIMALICIVMVIRIIGQKELAQTTPMDFIFMIILADIVGGMIHDKEFNAAHILFIVVLWGLSMWLAEKLTQKKSFERILDGKPEIIIKDGVANSQLMKKEHITQQELETQLRRKGIFDIKEVDLGILEIDGSISVKLKKHDGRRKN